MEALRCPASVIFPAAAFRVERIVEILAEGSTAGEAQAHRRAWRRFRARRVPESVSAEFHPGIDFSDEQQCLRADRQRCR
ncbi:MAG: hypothetical protein MZW92_77110 [Comamonadaceae bacterium]|nr:hypothetical protein [Comamonadaceae bacterium]